MQTTGYIEIKGKAVLVLVRQCGVNRTLKLRVSGKPGNHFEDEEAFLDGEPGKLEELLAGRTIKC